MKKHWVVIAHGRNPDRGRPRLLLGDHRRRAALVEKNLIPIHVVGTLLRPRDAGDRK